MNEPRVSIILPTYNGARFIEKSIESVLAQSFKEWELLVIDDGSSDGTAEVVNKLRERDERVHYMRNQENMGIQKTLNRGLTEARGELIARIDDDDTWIDGEKLARQVKFLDENPEYGLVGCGVVVMDENYKELFRYLHPETNEEIKKKLLFKNVFTHSAVLFRKGIVMECGGYGEGEDSKHIEDYALWLDVGRKCKLANLPIFAIGFMLREGTISASNKPEQLRKLIALIKRHKRDYPGYWGALAVAYLRVTLYKLYKILPFKRLKIKLFQIYKSS